MKVVINSLQTAAATIHPFVNGRSQSSASSPCQSNSSTTSTAPTDYRSTALPLPSLLERTSRRYSVDEVALNHRQNLPSSAVGTGGVTTSAVPSTSTRLNTRRQTFVSPAISSIIHEGPLLQYCILKIYFKDCLFALLVPRVFIDCMYFADLGDWSVCDLM